MLLGLIGYPLSHSFSPAYFAAKFERLGLKEVRYALFPLQRIDELPTLLRTQPDLWGFNVTIPYKQAVLPYLDALSAEAREIGAVNVVDCREGRLLGYNTDVWGFRKALEERFPNFLAKAGELKALVLGTGGASLAVCYAFRQIGLRFRKVSRRPMEGGVLTYEEISPDLLREHSLIVNTTPLGMGSYAGQAPVLPYEAIGPEHLLFDLIYNPAETPFLLQGRERGAKTLNGLRMLELQADAAWSIWAKGRILRPEA